MTQKVFLSSKNAVLADFYAVFVEMGLKNIPEESHRKKQ
jgi:hypothetical protein